VVSGDRGKLGPSQMMCPGNVTLTAPSSKGVTSCGHWAGFPRNLPHFKTYEKLCKNLDQWRFSGSFLQFWLLPLRLSTRLNSITCWYVYVWFCVSGTLRLKHVFPRDATDYGAYVNISQKQDMNRFRVISTGSHVCDRIYAMIGLVWQQSLKTNFSRVYHCASHICPQEA